MNYLTQILSAQGNHHRVRVRLFFGLFEADAAGALGISAVVLLFLLMGAGRWLHLW